MFDFEVGLRLGQQGFTLADMQVANPTHADGPSDDFTGLSIPYDAGDVFTLTYGEIDYDGTVLPGYRPEDDFGQPTGDDPNGARFEGLGFTTVPEPTTLLLVALAACSLVAGRRK